MSRRIGLGILFLFIVFGSGGLVAEERVEIQSDTLVVDHEEKNARFEGHVRGTIGALDVRCDRLELTYDDAGEVKTLRASGGVTVVHLSSTATAGAARLDAGKGVLVLEGHPKLRRGPHRLEGRRIVIDLKTGHLDVTEAKGAFSLKRKGGR